MPRFWYGSLFILALVLNACTPKTGESVFGTTVVPTQGTGFTGTIHFLDVGTGALPDFSNMTPTGILYTSSLDISPRSFEEGFPGISNRFEWFAIRYEASFEIVTPGDYSFRLLSDDGSRLYINGDLVIDNDGIHPPAEITGAVALTAGSHRMTVDYFQGPRTEIALQLFVTPPAGQESIFSTATPY